MGKFQRRILWAAGLCFAADSMEILLLSFLTVVLQEEWGLTDTQTSTITFSVFAGALMGSLTLGPLGDSIGRRPVFSLAAIIISVFGLLTAAANSFASLLIMRFLVGFGVGGLTVPFGMLTMNVLEWCDAATMAVFEPMTLIFCLFSSIKHVTQTLFRNFFQRHIVASISWSLNTFGPPEACWYQFLPTLVWGIMQSERQRGRGNSLSCCVPFHASFLLYWEYLSFQKVLDGFALEADRKKH